MAMPAGNMFWRDVPARAKVREHRNYFEVIDGKKRYVANWSSQDAREAQAWLKQRASGGVTPARATKRKTPAQLDREIAHAMKSDRWDAGPDAWQRGYEFAKEAARHETRAEQREVLRRVAPGVSEYDRGFMAGYQDVLGIPRERSHATRKGGGSSTGYEVSRTAIGKTRSAVFTSRSAAEKFHAANKGSHLREVQLDSQGRIVKQSHAKKKFDEALATRDPAALRRAITTRGHLHPKVVVTRYDDAGKAIDTVHTLKMSDGRVITTTWHDTKAEANKRIKNTAGRDPSHDRVLPDKILGNFKAVTWSY